MKRDRTRTAPSPLHTADLARARGGADGDILLHRWQQSGAAQTRPNYFDGKLLTASDLTRD